MMGGESSSNYQMYIEKAVNELISYLCKDKYSFLRMHHLNAGVKGVEGITDAQWYRIILEYDYQIKGTIIDRLIDNYKEANRASDRSSKEYTLINFLKKISIYEIDHSSHFETDWKLYIRQGL